MSTQPPDPVLHALDLAGADTRSLLWPDGPLRPLGPQPHAPWALRRDGRTALLKCYRPEQDEHDIQWEHDWLTRLAAAGFPAPVPLPLFAGQSWLRAGDRVWGALTFLPGRSLLWERRPGMAAVGAFLARYHQAAGAVPAGVQRPTAAPLTRLADVAPPHYLSLLLGADGIAWFRERVAELEQELHDLHYARLERIVIHGDPTTDNLVIRGNPPRIAGLIDFGAAYHEACLADLGCGLWRSGRAEPAAIALDPGRVARFVEGYHRRRPLTAAELRAVPVMIKARGLQLLARRARRMAVLPVPVSPVEMHETVQRVDWVRHHQRELTERIATLACR